MKVITEVLIKKSGTRKTVDESQRITLDQPSVVTLKLAPEKVQKFERRGDDLVVVTKDDDEVVIAGFYIKYKAEADATQNDASTKGDSTDPKHTAGDYLSRSDLILIDDNNVAWWGQYPENWTEFHFTEIEWNDAAGIFWPYILGGVGVAGLLGAAAGGGGGGKKNSAPDAVDDRFTGAEDQPVTGNLLKNDSDPNGDAITLTSFSINGTSHNAGSTVTIPGVGTLTIDSKADFTFTPLPNWNGTVPTVSYTVTDPSGASDKADLVITITPVTDLTAVNDSTTTQEDTPVNGTVASNDSTTSGGTLTYTKATDPTHGTVVVNPDGSYTYTPAKDYNGTDSFTYTVTDPTSGETATRTVVVDVTPVNDPPVPVNTMGNQSNTDASTVPPLDVTPFFNDVDGDTLMYTATGLPPGLSLDPVTGQITGTVDPSASQTGGGIYNVVVTANDGKGGTSTQTFDWTITNPAPSANNDTATSAEDTPVTGNVLGGAGIGAGDAADIDPDGDALVVTTFTVAGDPTVHTAGSSAVVIAGVGALQLGTNGQYQFIPNADWNGTVPTVTYNISDGEGGVDSATLIITVTPVNDAPVSVGTIGNQTSLDADTVTTLDVTSFFNDVDGDTLTYTATGLPTGLTLNPATGEITGTIDNSASQTNGGVYTVVVTANDGNGGAVTQSFNWTVTNPAPVANNDVRSSAEDTTVNGNVLGGTGIGAGDVADTDPDGDALVVTTFTVAGDPTVHTAGSSAVVIAGVGALQLGTNGQYQFIPNADWNGTVPTVTYNISDGEGGVDSATLIITVTPVNDAPVQVGSITDQTNLDADSIASLNITSFFNDVDGNTLAYTASGLPAGLTLNPTTGVISGTIDNSASQTNGGVYNVVITANDGNGGTVTQSFDWTVTNPAPIANNDTQTVAEDTVLTGNVLGGVGATAGDVTDTDPDGDTLVVTTFTIAGDPTVYTAGGSAVAIPNVGTLQLGTNGAYLFAPVADWNGTVPTITYSISDGEGGTDTATLNITVTDGNDPPVTVGTIADQTNLDADAIAGLNVTSYFNDIDGDTLTYTATGLPAGLTLNANTGVISGTIDNSASQTSGGVYTVVVTANDGNGGTVTQSFDWTVTNPSPTANNDAASTIEDTSVSGNVLGGVGAGATDVADTDPDGDTLTVTSFLIAGDLTPHTAGATPVSISGAGSLVLKANGQYQFTPNANWNGTVPVITYFITDSEGGTSSANLLITVTPVNDAPSTVGTIPNHSDADADVIAGVPTSGFFSDVDGDTLSYSATGLPTGLTIDSATGVISGTIDHSASQTNGGVYNVVVTANDGTLSIGQSFTWTIANPAPIANDDVKTTAEDTALSGNVLGGVGATVGDVADTDPDGDALTVNTVTIAGSATVHTADGAPVIISGIGTFQLSANGQYTFSPAANWNGNVPIITYVVSDGEGGTDTAVLNITVTPVDDPLFTNGTIADKANLDADSITNVDITSYFTDVDGDTLSYTATGLPPGLTINAATGVISGTIDHSASQTNAGVYAVTVTVNDGIGSTVNQQFTWTISNPAPIATNDTSITAEDTVVTGNVLGGVGAGVGDQADSDPDSDALVVTTFTVQGDVTVYTADGASVLIPGIGMLKLSANGAYEFTPALDWNGTVPTITYTISDGEGGTDTATLNIAVTSVNDAPTINQSAQFSNVRESGNLDDGTFDPGTNAASGNFTATDPDLGDTKTWSVAGTPDTTYGTFVVNASGAWTYTLNNALAATQALNEGDSVQLIYRVRVTDSIGEYAEQLVYVTINGTNDAPVANVDVGQVVESGVAPGGNVAFPGTSSATGNVLTNDTDVDDGEKATLKVTEGSFGGVAGDTSGTLTGTYGSLTLSDTGAYTYVLNNSLAATQALAQGVSATEVFSYTVIDVKGATSTNTLTITVVGTNDRPVITSAAADATGTVIEAGTSGPGVNTVSGDLNASDVDAGATQNWSVFGTSNGTYGTIAVDAATGVWTYLLDNTRAATQALNATNPGTETFTVRVTDQHGAYSEQIVTINVTGTNDAVTGTGNALRTENEDTPILGSLQTYVSDVDDVLTVTSFTVDANGDGVAENYAPGAPITLQDSSGNVRGTLTISADGTYSFVPTSNYAGDVPSVTYTMSEDSGGQSVTQTLGFVINKVSDAPAIGANKTVTGTEDNAISLGLTVPVITDTGLGTTNSDYPERIGEITLTLGGAGSSGVTFQNGATTLIPVGGKITIVLTDGPVISNPPAAGPGVFHMTGAEYQALKVNPKPESGVDFTVTVSVTSYEVDAAGVKLPTVAGATSGQVISVDVLAVTDGADLSTSFTDLTLAEDANFGISSFLSATLVSGDANPGNDVDGSERYTYSVTGLPVGSVVTIDGTLTTITSIFQVVTSFARSTPTPPSISIKPPLNFSGDMNGVKVTLTTLDTDTDSSGVISPVTDDVFLNFHVVPRAGDVTASDLVTLEDNPQAFLASVRVTDITAGSEVINSVSFAIPSGWVVTPPTASAGWTYSVAAGTATISFDNTLNEAAREAVLDGFMIQPPAHSSADATIALSITTTDSNTVDGIPVINTDTVTRNVTITVTPAADRVGNDSDGNGSSDVSLTPGHAYVTVGAEDAWFVLSTEGAFNLIDGWSDEDADEALFAVMTPTLSNASPGDSIIGTQFRYSTDGGATWVIETYVGNALWIPSAYLNTLEVKLPPNVAGTLTVDVQAGTRDTDPDTNVVVEDVSGAAVLSTIVFAGVADAVTLALNGRAVGNEDTQIPLVIRASSSDASETFNLTLSSIPAGAKIFYNGVEVPVAGGSVVISNFSHTVPLSILPPPNSNDDFQLQATAVSVDGSSVSTPLPLRAIDVSVTGVADLATFVLPAVNYQTTEAVLDTTGQHKVALSNLITSVASQDTDGSEVVTVRVTGLSNEFNLVGATVIVSGTGTERVWLLPANKLADVSVVTPSNYSGTVNFQVAAVTTENDGNSLTGPLNTISYTVLPSPEATLTTSATLVEDVITSLDLAIVHQNGDTNEFIGDVFIPVGYDASTFTVYLNGVELSAAGLSTVIVNGVNCYIIPGGAVDQLGALTAPNMDGALGNLNYFYAIFDPSNDNTLSSSSEIYSGVLAISASAVTDAVDATINNIVLGGGATGGVLELIPSDDATPDTVNLTHSGTVTVNMHVTSADVDGSEHVIRILIEGVPDGVGVSGASQVGPNDWVLIMEGVDAKSIGAAGVDVPVEFFVGRGTANGISDIAMTVQGKDHGDSNTSNAAIETDTVTWQLNANLSDGVGLPPPVITQWSINNTPGTEDSAFTLGDVIDAGVSIPNNTLDHVYTVTVGNLPPGTSVSGMIMTMVGGQPIYTLSVTVPAGGDGQAALDAAMAGVQLTPPANSNHNNASFDFDATLSIAAVGGPGATAVDAGTVDIIPVSDKAAISVVVPDGLEGDSSVTATISASDIVDGVNGAIVGGVVYVKVTDTNNAGGTVSDGAGNPLTPTAVTGVPGVPDGNYYVVNVGASGGSFDLTYTAPVGSSLNVGDITFSATAQTQEVGAANTETNTVSGTSAIEVTDNGVNVTTTASSGPEAANSSNASAIEITGLSVALIDNDGSETINTILLSGVPEGFLLLVGNSPNDATAAQLSSNAGGDGITNTWILSSDGTMPAYAALVPSAHWSGVLTGLTLVVVSGETADDTDLTQSFPLAPITVEAVANGLSLAPSSSFGTEGNIIDLNLNASMVDASSASALNDDSIETTTVQLTGLGVHAAFYINGVLVDASAVSYNAGTDTYTVTGLVQNDLDGLGFVQASEALTDQDAGTAGIQIGVKAWTVESGNADTSTEVTGAMTVALSNVLATNGSDHFIWGGNPINGNAGIDTVSLRNGEDLSNAQLASMLSRVEVIDLSAPGANSITGGLTVSDVLTITGSSTGTLTIEGTSDDHVALSASAGWTTTGVENAGHVAYTSGGGLTILVDADIYNSNHVTFV